MVGKHKTTKPLAWTPIPNIQTSLNHHCPFPTSFWPSLSISIPHAGCRRYNGHNSTATASVTFPHCGSSSYERGTNSFYHEHTSLTITPAITTCRDEHQLPYTTERD